MNHSALQTRLAPASPPRPLVPALRAGPFDVITDENSAEQALECSVSQCADAESADAESADIKSADSGQTLGNLFVERVGSLALVHAPQRRPRGSGLARNTSVRRLGALAFGVALLCGSQAFAIDLSKLGTTAGEVKSAFLTAIPLVGGAAMAISILMYLFGSSSQKEKMLKVFIISSVATGLVGLVGGGA